MGGVAAILTCRDDAINTPSAQWCRSGFAGSMQARAARLRIARPDLCVVVALL